MESSKLYIEIENIIRKNLQYAYNKNTSKVHFNLLNTYPDSGQPVDFGNFSVNLSDFDIADQKFCKWRLPQTRIYLSELSCFEFKISELQYFEDSFVLIKNYKPDELHLKIDTKLVIHNLNENSAIPNEIVIAANAELTLYLNKSADKINDINTYLNDLVTNERIYNPINNIFSTNVNLLKSIDSSWAAIRWDSRDLVAIDVKAADPVNRAISIMLSELSLYFDLKSESISGRSIANNQVQDFWNVISLPAFNHKLSNLLRKNPEHILSFLLAAYECNFWWADKARDVVYRIIKSHIPIMESLFNFLFTLKSHFNINAKQDRISIANFFCDSLNTVNSIKTSEYQAQFVQSHKRIVTEATFKDVDSISINKKARINFDIRKKKIKIHPQTFQYSLDFKNLLIITVDSIELEIAAVWKDFVVTFGSLRLKFLFKKNRYQISVMGNSNIRNFSINGNVLSFAESKYIKTYHMPESTETEHQFYLCDENGRSISDHNTLNPIGCQAIAQNKYGQIINNLQLRKKSLKKNIVLDPIGSSISTIDPAQSYELVLPKNGIIDIEPGFTDSLVTKVLYTDSSILEKQLCIFIDREDQLTYIRDKFYNVFGFFVTIKSFSEINYSMQAINIIVSDKPQGKHEKAFLLHDEILLKQKGQKKSLLFTEDNFIKWLNSFNKQ